MKIRLLGPVDVVDDDGARISLTATKPRLLLAFLALDAQRSRSMGAIYEALWGAQAPSTATNLVQGYISDLRRQLGRERLETTSAGYSLVISREQVDALVFVDFLHQAQRVYPTDMAACDSLLESALGLWAGPALGDLPADGNLGAAAVRLEEQLLDAYELKAETDLAFGKHASIVTRLEELVRLHPFRERLWLHLVTALYRSERQAEALRCCDDVRKILREELGLSPGPELKNVEQRILEQDPELMVENLEAPKLRIDNSTGFVGRASNLSRLSDLLDRARGGDQRFMFVGGEPGIGKTSLVQEFVSRAEVEDVVLVGRCDEHVAVPYLPFVQAISDHLGSLDESKRSELIAPRLDHVTALIPLPNENDSTSSRAPSDLSLLERFETFRWLLGRLRLQGPLVLILEDIHWADSTTLGLLRYLAQDRLPDSLLIATYRTSHSLPILDDLLADFRSNHMVERMVLHGLKPGALAELIASVDSTFGDVAWIEGETDGNPFFVRELVRHIAETGSFDGVPDGITEVVERRVRRLSAPAQDLLVTASLLGDDAPVGLLRLLSPDVENLSGAIRESVQAGILVEVDTTEPRYRFAHSIIRKAAAASLTAIHRQDLHLAAAIAWEKFRSGRAELATAAHYLGAGSAAPPDAAFRAFMAAAAHLDKVGAKVEAVKWYDNALNLLDDDDPRCRAIRLTRFVVAQAAWHWHYDRKSIERANASD